MLTPQDATVTVSGRAEGSDEQTLFQLPRTDSFPTRFYQDDLSSRSGPA